jgi:drug/metabolite transporter (DMT)-like permease
MSPERTSTAADLALLAVAAVWGLTFSAVQRALDTAAPFSFLAARFWLAAVVLAAVFPRRAFRLSRRALSAGLLIGLWLTAGYGLQTVGLLYTTASKSAFITGLCVVLVPVLSLLLSRSRISRTSLFAALLAAGGLYLLTSPRLGGLNLGDLLTLGCAVAFALHIVTTERVAPGQEPVALAFGQIVTTAIISTVLMFSLEGPRLPLNAWTLVALAITGVFATAVAFAVQMWAQRRTSATHVAVIFTAEPVFAALFAWLIQHELLGAAGLAGGALIIGGVLVSQIGARPRPASEPEAAPDLGPDEKGEPAAERKLGIALQYGFRREDMNDAAPVRPRASRGIFLVLIGAILAAAAALLATNIGTIIDSAQFYVNIPILAAVLGVASLLGIVLWVQGHRVYAQSKGHPSILGLVLGFLPVLGFLVLLALPARSASAAASEPEPEATAEPAAEQESG